MDEDIRHLRSRQWQSTEHERAAAAAPPDVGATSDTSKPTLFKFGHVAETDSTKEEPVEFDARKVQVEALDTDEEIMLRQLNRKSAPYTHIPIKKEEETEDDFLSPPGSYPRDDYSHSFKHETMEDEDIKPETKPFVADDRTCRICFSQETADDRLISPCKCRGTSKWIHLTCLNEWRTHSQNSKSYYRCDQCHYEYSFRRTDAANLLLSRYTLLALTCLAFTFAAFVGGFFIKFGLWLMPPDYLLGSSGWTSHFSFFYTPLDAGTDMLSAASALIPSTPRVWQDIFVIDVWHFLQGIISLGIIGVVGFMGTGGLFSLRTFRPRRTRRQGESLGIAELAFILVILLGCGKVAHSMWKRVRQMVKRKLAKLGERILEVDPDQL